MVAVPSDADLATEALAGSQEAYRELVSRYATAAVNLSARLVRDRALAEDLAQKAFVRAFTRLASYDPRRKFSSWFLQVVHNVAVDHLRRKRLSTVPLDDPPATNQLTLSASSTEPSPAAHAEREELRRALEQALAAIRPEYREALVPSLPGGSDARRDLRGDWLADRHHQDVSTSGPSGDGIDTGGTGLGRWSNGIVETRCSRGP